MSRGSASAAKMEAEPPDLRYQALPGNEYKTGFLYNSRIITDSVARNPVSLYAQAGMISNPRFKSRASSRIELATNNSRNFHFFDPPVNSQSILDFRF